MGRGTLISVREGPFEGGPLERKPCVMQDHLQSGGVSDRPPPRKIIRIEDRNRLVRAPDRSEVSLRGQAVPEQAGELEVPVVRRRSANGRLTVENRSKLRALSGGDHDVSQGIVGGPADAIEPALSQSNREPVAHHEHRDPGEHLRGELDHDRKYLPARRSIGQTGGRFLEETK